MNTTYNIIKIAIGRVFLVERCPDKEGMAKLATRGYMIKMEFFVRERFGNLTEESMSFWLQNEVLFVGKYGETWHLPKSAGVPGSTRTRKMGECY